jgi:hypothetical protein
VEVPSFCGLKSASGPDSPAPPLNLCDPLLLKSNLPRISQRYTASPPPPSAGVRLLAAAAAARRTVACFPADLPHLSSAFDSGGPLRGVPPVPGCARNLLPRRRPWSAPLPISCVPRSYLHFSFLPTSTPSTCCHLSFQTPH